MEGVAEPIGVLGDLVFEGFEEAGAVVEEAVAGGGTEVAAGLGGLGEEGVFADFGGEALVAGAVVEEGFDEEGEEGGVVGLHGLGGLLVDVFVHFAPGDGFGGEAGGEGAIGDGGGDDLDVEVVAADVGEAEDLAEGGFGLEVEVLGNPAAEDERPKGVGRVFEEAPIVIGAGFEDFGVDIQFELVMGEEAGLAHGPQFHGVEEDGAIAGSADKEGDGEAVAGGEEAGGDAVAGFQFMKKLAQKEAHFGAGHFALEFGALEDGGKEAVLVEEDVLVEGHVGDADGAFVAEGGVVAEDGDFVDGVGVAGEGAMAVVVAHGVGAGEVGDPAGFEEGDEPGLVLTGDGDGSGEGEGEGDAGADGGIEDGVDAAEVGAAEGGKAVAEEFVEGLDVVDAAGADGGAAVEGVGGLVFHL